MTDIKKINGVNGKQFYPQTHQRAVLVGPNETLEDYLQSLTKRINEMDSVLFSKSCTLSATKTNFEYSDSIIGGKQSGSFSFSAKYKGENIPRESKTDGVSNSLYITDVSFTLPQNKSIGIDTSAGGDWWKTSGSIEFYVESKSNGSPLYSLSASVTINITLNTKEVLKSSITITQFAPIFMGLCAFQREDLLGDSRIINSLASNTSNSSLAIKQIGSAKFTNTIKTFTILGDNLSFWIAVPESFGLPVSYSNKKLPFTMTNDENKIGINRVSYRGIPYSIIRNFSDTPLLQGEQLSIEVSY